METETAATTGKRKYPRADAIAVARALVSVLAPCCSKIMVAGSLRRRKAEVGDVEILYVPNVVALPDKGDLFAVAKPANAADYALDLLLEHGSLAKRPNSRGSTAWGEKNKLAVHLESGIPVDLFAANHDNWWNLVVCRTGGRLSNLQVCAGAIAAGWKWNPYGEGFSRPNPERPGWLLIKPVSSEAEVFQFAGLDYLEPWERE